MSENYRELLSWGRTSGEAVVLPYSEHCREAILEELQGRLVTAETGYEDPYMREEAEHEDMLWMLNREEVLEKGIYSWNRPMADLLIVAPPALMALIMGEYELAVKLNEHENLPYWKNRVEELYQDRGRSGIGGGQYSFGEACLLSIDMPVSVKLFFWQRGYYDEKNIFLDEKVLLSEAQFHRTGQKAEDDFWNIMKEIRNLGEMFEDTRELFILALEYALRTEKDRRYKLFWERLYQTFETGEEHHIIVEVMHRYFVNLGNECGGLSSVIEKRVLAGLQVYFKYEDSLFMGEGVEKYLLNRMTGDVFRRSIWKSYLEQYLNIVKGFIGPVTEGWQQGMYELLESEDENLILDGFKCGYLKTECILEYIEFLIQEHFKDGKGYTNYISRLIQLKWKMDGVLWEK